MIKNLSIKNFKSLKKFEIPCKKVNVFIGEPNSGKSNILEALGFLSEGVMDTKTFSEVFRYKTIGDLFYHSDVNNPIEIKTDILSYKMFGTRNNEGIVLNGLTGIISTKDKSIDPNHEINIAAFNFSYNTMTNAGSHFDTPFRTYIFRRNEVFSVSYQNFLSPPFGTNIPNLLLSNKDLKKIVSDMFKEKGYKLQIKPTENDINMSVEIDEELYSYPYHAISETMQRIVFMMMAIESNKNAILSFDEPESNTFPFYTKYIAERIALDETNQFFITTHNPYLLMNIIQKTKKQDLNVFVTYMDKFQTKAKLLNSKQIEEAIELDMDLFFNLDRIIGK
jgi:AAA15 family ATPase/GTPase